MNKTVWKQELMIVDKQSVTVPEFSQFLHVDVQNDVPCLWYLCDPTKSLIERQIFIVSTGQERNDLSSTHHISTFQVDEHSLVFHVFAYYD